jgi:hypothetical protein
MFSACGATQRLLAAGVTAALLAGNVHAAKKSEPKPPPGSRLTGQVRMADGKSSARGVVIEVRPLDGRPAQRSAPTDKRGRFKLEKLPYGWAELVVVTEQGGFLGDQSLNLPPGSKVEVRLTLLPRQDRPESWWTERHLEPPADLAGGQLTGVEYWKSPTGIVILAAAGVVALAVIASGGSSYTAP